MFRSRRLYATLLTSVIPLLIGGFVTLRSQTPGRELIREAVDESKLVALAGNTRPEANAGNDRGAVADDLTLHHILLQLKRSPEQERAVEKLVADLHNPQSPAFHKWLTAEEFGRSYGVAEADLQILTAWLQSKGFTVNRIYPSGMAIDLSGTAGQVRTAFHTEIHNLDVDGVHHIANFGDPRIPQALAPAVAGIVSMHDFRPHKMARARLKKSAPEYTFNYMGQTYQAVVPGDLATIYNFNPAFAANITGTGQTVVVVEDTDLYTPRRGASDWATFRSEFGLTQYTAGSLITVHPGGCGDPGVNGDDDEAILDAEWASAAAPSATIEVASCADTEVTFGVQLAAENLVNSTPSPAIMSISYGECEALNGTSSNAALNSLYQQAVVEGISVFVAAGDEGAASCDAGAAMATHGISVSAFASTPYNVAVGGTDFADVVNGTANMYWSGNNTLTYASALSYIPEMPWNNSCAGSLLANFNGYSTVYGANGFCASSLGKEYFTGVIGGSGGPSNCATGTPATPGIASGSCQGYPKPTWQAGLSGIPADSVRDIPDVSMFAADGVWGHYSVVCFSDPESLDSASCSGAPDTWAGFGGTSVAAPVLAGVQALVNQKAGGKQGNPNPVYYGLAASNPNVFNSVTTGDNDMNCGGSVNCYGYAGTVMYGRGGRLFGTTWAGALSTSETSFAPAYGTGPGFNLATGIGSVNVANLVNNWGAK